MILIGSPDEIRALVAHPPEQKPILIRAQESGPCVYYDPDGTAPKDGDGPDYRKDPPRCTYPYPHEGGCPHLDDPAILCPVKDACYAMFEVARLQEACEAEQEEQDQATADETEPAEGRETPRGRRWTSEEDTVLQLATSAAGAQGAYQEVFPGSGRTPAAVSSRWYKVRQRAPAPTTDFTGDPVTQRDEPPRSKGFYGDVRALEADLVDGMMCDAPLSAEPGSFRPGDRAALISDPDRVGKVTCVSPSGVSVSVQFPGDGPARVFAIGDLRRVV